jgi:CDP-paratose 2-epimerase
MRILITGAAGMIGSHAAEFYAQAGHEVVALDNLMRSKLFNSPHPSVEYNWQYLERYPNIRRVIGDARSEVDVKGALSDGVDALLHAAGQPGVFYSLEHPREDFTVNALGTLNVLECARQACPKARVVYCSTNKVYGHAVEKIPLRETKTRYEFAGDLKAIPETFDVDLVGHTPYGVSKYTGDLYAQEYAHAYGMKTAVFRMSCIYGTRQFGFEDQGWLAWFAIRCFKKQPITIFGDGKQVRDALFVGDLIRAYDAFLQSDRPSGVYNMGGGSENTLSLLELLEHLKNAGLPSPPVRYDPWRMFDQKVYISDIRHACQALDWRPTVSVAQGVERLARWVRENETLFP